MNLFNITILFVISTLCHSNLTASQLLNKKENKQELQRQLEIERLEMKAYLAHAASYNKYSKLCQIQKSESVTPVTDKKNNDYEQNERAATVRLKTKPVLTSEKPPQNLFTAIQSANPDYLQIQLLLKNNSSINLINDQGYTPLHLIVHQTINFITNSEKRDSTLRQCVAHRTEIIKLLVEHGADTSIIDPSGQSLKNQVKAALSKTSKHTNPYRRIKRINGALKKTKKTDTATKEFVPSVVTPVITKEPIKLLN